MSIAIADKTPYWVSLIGSELEQVEIVLQDIVQSKIDTARNISLRLFDAGGKRLRPALVILSALAVNPEGFTDNVAGIAATIELLHTASLIHDDVVDDSITRRGIPTANSIYGNRISVLSGDYMLSRSLALLSIHGDMLMLQDIASVATLMAECEVLQAMCIEDIDMWAANYMSIIDGKTAALLSAGCRCGARLSKASSSTIELLSAYGQNIGIAFQITDDILDVIGDPKNTGKSVCTDLAQGKFTMPVLAAHKSKDPHVLERLKNILQTEITTDEEAREATDFLVKCGAVDSAREIASEHIALAISSLSKLPQNQYTQALSDLASRIIDRIS